MHRFKIGGEYFDHHGDAHGIVAGSFKTIFMAKRAIAWIKDYRKAPAPGKIPPELSELAFVVEEETLEIMLYVKSSEGYDEWVMSFDPDTGDPIEAALQVVASRG